MGAGLATTETVTSSLGLESGILVPLQSAAETYIALVFLFVFGLALLYDGFRTYRTQQLIRDTPTSKVRSMSVGRVECQGRARPKDTVFERPFTEGECLYAKWTIDEKRILDGGSKWTNVDSGTILAPFTLEDDTGSVVVRATRDTEFDFSDSYRRRFTVDKSARPPDPVVEFLRASQNADVQYDGSMSWITSNRRRYTEWVLAPDQSVYVFGKATQRPTDEGLGNTLVITEDDLSGRFLVSDRSAKELVNDYGRKAPLMIVSGLALSAVSLWAFFFLLFI